MFYGTFLKFRRLAKERQVEISEMVAVKRFANERLECQPFVRAQTYRLLPFAEELGLKTLPFVYFHLAVTNSPLNYLLFHPGPGCSKLG